LIPLILPTFKWSANSSDGFVNIALVHHCHGFCRAKLCCIRWRQHMFYARRLPSHWIQKLCHKIWKFLYSLIPWYHLNLELIILVINCKPFQRTCVQVLATVLAKLLRLCKRQKVLSTQPIQPAALLAQ
jgi:hypothetical protein